MSVITRLKEKFFPDEEFHFKGTYVYCGQGTKLEPKIKNLDFVIRLLNHGYGIDNIEIVYTSPSFVPINRADKYCLEHDLFYHISGSYSNSMRKRLEQEADKLLINRLEELTEELPEYSIERIDCMLIMGIMEIKMRMDEKRGCECCILS